MSTSTQFSWSRLEGLGLIAAALGCGILAQLPPTYFVLSLLYLNLEIYFIALIGTLLGTCIILATISCSLAEDWNDFIVPNLKNVITISFFFALVYIGGFFLYYIIEPIFPPEFTNLVPSQRYFSAIALALTSVGVITSLIYKFKKFF